MNILAWLLRLLFFLAVLWFALKNTMPVTLRLTENLRWDDVPLVLVMLGSLLVGMLLGAMALAPRLYRLHRRVAAADTGKRRVDSSPTIAADVGGDRLANVARRAGAVGELDMAEGGSAATRR
jgi:lipopolysaccharide assembly protein A